MKTFFLFLTAWLVALVVSALPTTTLHDESCGLTNVKSTTPIAIDKVLGAFTYRIELTNTNKPETFYLETSLPHFTLGDFNATFEHNTIYKVRVRIKDQAQQWGNWGSICEITTAQMATTALNNCRATQIEPTHPFSFNTVANATHYEIIAQNTTAGSDTIIIDTNSFTLLDFPDLEILSNATYEFVSLPIY